MPPEATAWRNYVREHQSTLLPDFTRQVRIYLDQPLPPDVELIVVPSTLKHAVPKRRLQFRSGRYCAMKAIESLDARFSGRQIGRSPSGVPVWPEGLVGSITHTDDFASAAVALSSDAIALGIDTERILTEWRARDVGRMVAWPSEVGHARSAGLSRLEALTLVFSAKESIFKCLHPIIGRYFDFHDMRVIEVDGQRRTFVARVVKTLSESFPAQTLLKGTFDLESPWIHTGIVLLARRETAATLPDPSKELA